MASLKQTYYGVRFTPKALRVLFKATDELLIEDYLRRYEFGPGELSKDLGPMGLEEGAEHFILDRPTSVLQFSNMSVARDTLEATFDDVDEFLTELRTDFFFASLTIGDSTLLTTTTIEQWTSYATVKVESDELPIVRKLFTLFEDAAADASVGSPEEPTVEAVRPQIFLGHGGKSTDWMQLQLKLQQHGFQTEAFESGARAGHAIRDILSDFLDHNSFAVVILTKEDERDDGSWVARQNVVHEAGLFQGRLGFGKVALLVEDGTGLFSNLDGIQHIPYPPGQIAGTIGEIILTINREFPKDAPPIF